MADNTEQMRRNIAALHWLKASIQYAPLGSKPDRRMMERRSKVHIPRGEIDARRYTRRTEERHADHVRSVRQQRASAKV